MPTTRPYLVLRERLSQIWINRYTLILTLALVKLFLFARTLSSSLENSKHYVLDHCTTIDNFYNSLRDGTPHYMTKMGNFVITKAVEATVDSTLALISMLVTVAEFVVVFMVELWLGTQACLLFSAIHGAVDLATSSAEKVVGFVNSTVITAANDIDDGLNALSKVINEVLKVTDKVGDLFRNDDDDDDGDGEDINSHIKKVNLTIAALRKIQIPSSVNEKLQSLSKNTPDFETVKNKTKTMVVIPLQKLKTDIKSVNTTGMIKSTDLMEVPPIYSSGENGVCSANRPGIEKLYGNLDKTLKYTLIVIIVMLLVGAIAAMVPVAWSEYRQWCRLEELREAGEESKRYTIDPFGDNYKDIDVIECHQTIYNRFPSYTGKWLARYLARTHSQENEVRWLTAYIFSPRAIVILFVAITGLLLCLLQHILLQSLERSLLGQDSAISKIASSTGDHLSGDMKQWAASSNSYIGSAESSINDHMFGWLTTATSSLNDTTSTLLNDIDGVVNSTFKDTPLYGPMNTVVRCVISDKLRSVEKGLTWLHDHAHISLPRIDQGQLQSAIDEQASDNSQPSSSPSSIHSMMQTLGETMKRSILLVIAQHRRLLRLELIISLAILTLWCLQLPIALFWLTHKRYRAARNSDCSMPAYNFHA
ncbi:HCL623Wp [Eremothecium sinecaudum]|uniref:Plasma membrane fusion protein PRM1 n=1 Tax=Eremothecium sinecaudum TaxID=45286 RepID=A0A109UXV3_9SACH|nr:HCL623Wp [Eremothecium sinecaudum]AMD19528.1 HCL623Wp [Eremothecium sinecaudum]